MNKSSHHFGVSLMAMAVALGLSPGLTKAQSPLLAPSIQNGGPPTVEQRRAERAERREKAQALWDRWRANPASAGEASLTEIVVLQGIRPTKDNAAALIDALRTKGGPRDKALLARIAGDLYRDLGEEGDKQTQETVRAYVSQLAKSETEPQLWKAVAYTYSRMGWFPDSMLVFARSKLIWGDREYYGELAHAVLSAPQSEQVKIIKELEAGDTKFGGGFNDFGKEILANDLKNEHAVKTLHPEAARAALAMFKKKEPAFAAEPEKMGIGSLSAYSDWAAAVVTLTAHASGEPPKNVLARMVQVERDPRKLIAVLNDSQTSALLVAAMDQKSIAAIDASINAYGAKHKTNPNVQDFVGIARRRLAEQR